MYILDIEASGLEPVSYPIEIAFTNLETGNSDEFLINPASIFAWDHWSAEAEEIHSISRETLAADGITPDEALSRLNTLSDQSVFSDAPLYDEYWLSRLYEAMGEKPRYTVKDLRSLVDDDQRADFESELRTARRPHRAMADVEVLADLVRRHR